MSDYCKCYGAHENRKERAREELEWYFSWTGKYPPTDLEDYLQSEFPDCKEYGEPQGICICEGLGNE